VTRRVGQIAEAVGEADPTGHLPCRATANLAVALHLGIPAAAGDASHPCAAFDAETHQPFTAELVEVMRQPSVVHAASMFFLWAGNPRAALTMIRHLEEATRPDAPHARLDYPGLQHVRGFAERWIADSNSDPNRYLDDWDRGVDQLEARIEGLRRAEPALLEGCGALSSDPVRLVPAQLSERLVNRPRNAPLPGPCGTDAALCDARLAYGYFTYQLFRARSHIVYETAREVMTGRAFPERSLALERASGHAERLLAEVEAARLGSGGCFAQQTVAFPALGAAGPGDAELPTHVVALTTTRPEQLHATALDGDGSLRLARAVIDGRVDQGEADRAIASFDRALRLGAMSGLSADLMATIRDHRDQARRATGAAAP